MIPFDRQIDARDLLCPLPVLRARKALLAMREGEVLQIAATDPAAVLDMPHFARESGHDYLGSQAEQGATLYFLRRGPDRPISDL